MQHMAENTLALLQHLSSSESPLPSLTTGYAKPTTVFFQIFGFFVIYSFKTAITLYLSLLGFALMFVRSTFAPPAPAVKHGRGFVADHAVGLLAVVGAVVGALISVNLMALFMDKVLNKPLSWFSIEFSCLGLYGPGALAGALTCMTYVVPSHISYC